MSLHDYANDILGSRTSILLLRALLTYKGKVFTIRELARTAKVSHPETSKVLKKLEQKAVVRLQPVGKAQQVSLNAESYILKSIVEPLFSAEKNTVASLAATVEPFFRDSRITSVAIFGSLAMGTESATSDVDLLIIADDRELAIERAARANNSVISRFGVPISPLIITLSDFVEKARGPLERSILDSFILVAGKDPRELIEGAEASR